jgi:hypothetical protein
MYEDSLPIGKKYFFHHLAWLMAKNGMVIVCNSVLPVSGFIVTFLFFI